MCIRDSNGDCVCKIIPATKQATISYHSTFAAGLAREYALYLPGGRLTRDEASIPVPVCKIEEYGIQPLAYSSDAPDFCDPDYTNSVPLPGSEQKFSKILDAWVKEGQTLVTTPREYCYSSEPVGPNDYHIAQWMTVSNPKAAAD